LKNILTGLVATIIAVGLIAFTFSSNDTPISKKFSNGIKSGIIEDYSLSEASGIVSSRINPELLWVINDSGNAPCLYLINKQGKIQHTYWIEDAMNLDWEDIAIYSQERDDHNSIFIADIGDNFAIRDHITVYAVEEPDWTTNKDSTIKISDSFLFRYEDGPRDAETLLVDPITSELLIITKREENVRIYQAPASLSSTDTMLLKYTGSLPFRNITAGDVTQSGHEILIKSYLAIFYWTRKESLSIAETLQNEHEILQYKPEPQGESIAWDLDAKGFHTLSEKRDTLAQVLYYYERQ